MNDPFVLLDLPRKLEFSSGELDERVRLASQQNHPDAGGDGERFQEIRRAGDLLKSPASRIRTALDVEGISFDERGAIPHEVMDYFSPVAGVLEKVSAFTNERAKARSVLGKAVLDARVPALKGDLEKLIADLGELESSMVARFPEFDERGWGECGEEMMGVARGLVFVGKWMAQLREANGKLFEALLGG